MKITLYQNVSERNQMDKTLTKVKDIDGKFKQSTNIMSPVLVLSYATLPDFNYIYIEELARYYFVDSITSINEGLWQINCSEDVLETYGTAILNLSAYVTRNENEYNDYIEDKYLLRTARKLYDIIEPLDLDDGHNLFMNFDSFDTSNSHDGAPYNISSETRAFCYTISTANKWGGRDVTDTTIETGHRLDIMEAYTDINDTNSKYGINKYGKAFYGDSFTKIWAMNNTNIQSLGSLLEAEMNSPIGDKRMYQNVGSMINVIRVYPFSIPEYYKYCGISESRLPQGNFPPWIEDTLGDSRNIDVVTVGDSPIPNTITDQKNTITQYPYSYYQITGWVLPQQAMSCKIATFPFDDTNILYNNYLDFSPYTVLHLYVPFFGYIDLQPNICIGSQVNVYLSVDFNSGNATLYVTSTIEEQETLVTTKQTSIGFDLAFGASNIAELNRSTKYTSIRETIKTVAGTLATFASIAAYATGHIGAGKMLAVAGGATIAGINSAINVAQSESMPVNATAIDGGGSENGASNFIAPKGIFILRERVEEYRPASNYAKFLGRPLEIQKRIGNLHGFTQVGSVHIEGRDFAKATEQEKQTIEDTLKNGFILR